MSPDGTNAQVVEAWDLARAPELKLYYVTNLSGSMQVWRSNPDGSSPEQLTDLPGECAFPTPIDDGIRVLFLLNNELWIMHPDGSGPAPVLGHAPGSSETQPITMQYRPSYSATRHDVIFSTSSCSAGFALVNLDTGEVRPVIGSPISWSGNASFLPSGDDVAFVGCNCSSSPTCEIYTGRLEGDALVGITRLTSDTRHDSMVWAGSSGLLSFMKSDSPSGYNNPINAYTMESDGSALHRWTEYSQASCDNAFFPTLSPDENTLLYSENKACSGISQGLFKIISVDLSTGTPTTIFDGSAVAIQYRYPCLAFVRVKEPVLCQYRPSYSPSRDDVIVSTSDCSEGFQLLNLTTGQLRPLAGSPVSWSGNAAFLQDGERIVYVACDCGWSPSCELYGGRLVGDSLVEVGALTNDGQHEAMPAVSLYDDIAYMKSENPAGYNEPFNIYTIGYDGSGEFRVTTFTDHCCENADMPVFDTAATHVFYAYNLKCGGISEGVFSIVKVDLATNKSTFILDGRTGPTQYRDPFVGTWQLSVSAVDPGSQSPGGEASNAGTTALSLNSRPNPFNPATEILYSLNTPADVEVVICDIRGRVVRTFNEQGVGAGDHSIRWDGNNNSGQRVASGVYGVRLRAGSLEEEIKVTVLK
jgi:Tol biopolymer transport system component